MSSHPKKGLTPRSIDDLRREFRRRSARKNQDQQQKTKTAGKSSSSSHVRRKTNKKHIQTRGDKSVYVPPEETVAASKYQASVPSKPTGSAEKVDKISACDEDQPTEFEMVPGAKPAVFAPEWHKGSAPQEQRHGNGKKKSDKRSGEKKKHKKSGKKTSRHQETTSTATTTTTTVEDEKHKMKNVKVDEGAPQSHVSSSVKKKSGSRGRRSSDNGRRDKRKTPAQLASQYKDLKASPEPKSPKSPVTGENACTSPHRLSAEKIDGDMPLMSLEDDEIEKTTRASPTKLIPVKDTDFKLKPLVMPGTSPSPVTLLDDEFTASDTPDELIETAPPKVIERDKCGNANFPLVVAAGRIIDYCDEKDLFKEFIDPADLPAFNSFLVGDVKSLPELLTILDHLMDQIVFSQKLAETEAISKDLAIINRDRAEGRNYLLDYFLSKKAKMDISEQVLTAKKTSSVPNTTTSNTSMASNSGDSNTQSDPTQTTDLDEKCESKDKEK